MRKYKILIIVCMLIGVVVSLVFYRLFEFRVQKIPRWSIGRYHLDSLLTANDPWDNPIFSARSFVGGEAMFVADPYVFSGSDSLICFMK